MLREHRWSYTGLAVVLVIASTLVGVSFLLSQAASMGLPDRSGLTRNEVAIRLGQLSSGGVVADYLVFIATFLAGILVFQIVAFLIDGRRQEIALLRLSGAKRRQVVGLLLGESLILSAVASLLGGLLALACVTPFAQLLTLSNNWPVDLNVEVQPLQLLPCIVLVPVAATAGTLAAAIRAIRVSPIEATSNVVSGAAHRPFSRLVVAGLGVVSSIAVLLQPYDDGTLLALPSLVGALAVVVAATLSPFLIPAISAPFGYCMAFLAPGSGLIARKRIGFDRYRAAAVSAPIIILLALGTVFGMFALTGRAYTAAAYQSVTNAQLVVEVPGDHQDRQLANHVSELPGVIGMTRTQSTKLWSWDDPKVPEDATLLITSIDPQTFLTFIPAAVVDGDFSRVSDSRVAVTMPSPYGVGDTFAISSPTGDTREVSVVAVVESSPLVRANLLIDTSYSAIADRESLQTWFLHTAPDSDASSLASAVAALMPDADTLTRKEWIVAQSQRETETLYIAVLTIVGGGAMFAMVSLALTVLASARERERELETLRKSGARARSVVASVMLETALTCAAALLLGGGIITLVYIRMRSALEQVQAGMHPVLPSELIVAISLVCVAISLLAAATGASLALRSSTERRV